MPPEPPSAPPASAKPAILVLHGPNLNLLGSREPELYGQLTLAAIDQRLVNLAAAGGAELATFQSNSESALIDRVQQARSEQIGFILINPAALSHTSIALRDALAAVRIPFIEVHLSNVFAREPFRRKSFFSDLAVGVISGLGASGYELALTFAIERLKS
ncbi:MAG: type II 3-dehydroquinate dehydratase [Burkholderiales bacterium]|nr:type II 3-dehydroquinate dehydratase [Burkholderiales bacterium]